MYAPSKHTILGLDVELLLMQQHPGCSSWVSTTKRRKFHEVVEASLSPRIFL
jgi:hypothetical protein